MDICTLEFILRLLMMRSLSPKRRRWAASQDNILVDRGIATAAETGVYGPEGDWLIEGHGVDPDVVVDNLPRATAEGGDAQLDAAVRLLLDEIAKSPKVTPPPPRYPDKSGRR